MFSELALCAVSVLPRASFVSVKFKGSAAFPFCDIRIFVLDSSLSNQYFLLCKTRFSRLREKERRKALYAVGVL